jgi:hypothetical protein
MLLLKFKKQEELMYYFNTGVERAIGSNKYAVNDGVECKYYKLAKFKITYSNILFTPKTALSSTTDGILSYKKSVVYNKEDNLVCNLHCFDCTNICTWNELEAAKVKFFFIDENAKLVGVKRTEDDYRAVYQPHHNEMVQILN